MNANANESNEVPEISNIERLTFLHDQVMREQEMYWSRFYSFATLSAGAFLLTTSKELDQLLIAVLGLGLAAVWVLVQFVGLGYVDRTKPPFHEMRREMGFTYSYGKGSSEDDPPRLLGVSWASATNIGVWVSIIVLGFWIVTVVKTVSDL